MILIKNEECKKKNESHGVGGMNDSFVTFCKSDDRYIVPDI